MKNLNQNCLRYYCQISLKGRLLLFHLCQQVSRFLFELGSTYFRIGLPTHLFRSNQCKHKFQDDKDSMLMGREAYSRKCISQGSRQMFEDPYIFFQNTYLGKKRPARYFCKQLSNVLPSQDRTRIHNQDVDLHLFASKYLYRIFPFQCTHKYSKTRNYEVCI
jgi:hypothetical protein